MSALPLKSILTTQVVTCGSSESLGDVLRAMERRQISCVVVTDAERHPCGIFTERDAVALLAEDRMEASAPIRDAMSTPVLTVPVTIDTREAHSRMQQRGVRHLVAVGAGGEVVGVISEADFLTHLGEEYMVELTTVGTAMSAEVNMLDAGSSLADAFRLMHARRCDHVVIVDGEEPAGIITDRDAVRLAASGTSLQTPVVELMTRGVHGIGKDQPLLHAVWRMADLGVRRLLVNEGGSIHGMLTRHDVVRSIQNRDLDLLRNTIARLRREQIQPGGRYSEFARHAILGGVIDRIGDGVLLSDGATGVFVEANDRACELLGWARDELLERRVWDVSTRFPDEPSWQAWRDGVDPQSQFSEAVLRRRDGSPLPVELWVYRVDDGERALHAAIFRDRSAQVRIEAALREGERYYRHVIDSAIDGYFAMDRERRFVQVNDRLCELFGYARGEFIGHSPLEFVTEASKAELIAQMGRIDSTDQRRYQLVARRKNGTTFPILLNNSTHRDENGEVIGSFGFITDLTPIVEAQRAVADSERELRAILDDLQDTYYRTDTNGVVVRASRSVIELLGYTPEEMIGRRLAEFYCSQEEREEFLAKMQANGGHIVGGESRLRHKDGHEMWVLTNAHFILDTEGRVIGVEGTTRDNTERRRAEQELRLAAKVLENSGEAIMVTDPQGVVLKVNQAFTRITGFSAPEVVGRNASLLSSGRQDANFYKAMWQGITETGYWQGEIWNRRRNGEVFPEWLGISAVRDANGAITHFVGIFSDISERKASEAKIAFLAHHDALTGLPNRLLLKDRMQQAMVHAGRTGRRVALLFVDLDRFKAVNDSFGHPVGDTLLRDASQRLLACVRESDTVSRHGGDEFLVVLTDLQMPDIPARVAEKIMAVLGERFRIDGHEAAISASVGISVFPEDGESFDELLRKADIAMYHAKSAGRNAFRFYTEHMNADAQQRLDLHNALRCAIEQGEFLLHYQPVVDLRSGRIVGAEALARWNNRRMGMVSPAGFITAAEHSGLIVPLGEWVLQEACAELARWHKAGHDGLSMAVNISAIQFRRGDVEDTVLRALSASGVRPDALVLELTESILIDGADQVLVTIRRLQALGVHLAIDDFGTGYSSLAYLKRFAANKLKVDQSFVRDIVGDADDASIVRALIQLAHSLGLQVVAEGVESDAVMEVLRDLGCDYVQGYHFGVPMPADEFRKLIGAG